MMIKFICGLYISKKFSSVHIFFVCLTQRVVGGKFFAFPFLLLRKSTCATKMTLIKSALPLSFVLFCLIDHQQKVAASNDSTLHINNLASDCPQCAFLNTCKITSRCNGGEFFHDKSPNYIKGISQWCNWHQQVLKTQTQTTQTQTTQQQKHKQHKHKQHKQHNNKKLACLSFLETFWSM